ncbi:TdeIII family type II restriction endonuclease [Alkalihalobacillus sp. NPDC078783]
MERLINRRVNIEPFDEKEIEAKNPFGFRLVPVEVWKGSKFERSFVTILGQGIFEQIAKIIAEGS